MNYITNNTDKTKLYNIFFIKGVTLTIDPILIVLLKLI